MINKADYVSTNHIALAGVNTPYLLGSFYIKSRSRRSRFLVKEVEVSRESHISSHKGLFVLIRQYGFDLH
jgi:hypothetical protein